MRFVLCLMLPLLLSLPVLAAPTTTTGNIKVRITGLDVAPDTQLRVALFRGEQGWPKFKRALHTQILPVDSKELNLSFDQLAYGEDYAIMVHHDQNGNGKFDMRWFPYPRPKEGAGVSNNVQGFGSPDFSAARFSLRQPELNLYISVNY